MGGGLGTLVVFGGIGVVIALLCTSLVHAARSHKAEMFNQTIRKWNK